MIVLMVVVIIVAVMMAYVMLMPVTFVIDTDEDLYGIFQRGVFSFRVVTVRPLSTEVRIAGIKISVKPGRSNPQQKVPEKRAARNKTRSVAAWRFLIRKLLAAFKVHRFQLDVDTGDVALNARLFPVVYFTTRNRLNMNINFVGRNYFGFIASVRPITLIRAYLIFLTKK